MPVLIGAMVAIVASANYLVQFPLNDWLTLGALTYPVAFFVTDVANRRYGPEAARKVVYSGFVPGLLISIWLSSPRIAFASGSAFLIAQLLDVAIFNHLRQRRSEEHTSELQSRGHLVCRLLLETNNT